jgi:hypothetical protein
MTKIKNISSGSLAFLIALIIFSSCKQEVTTINVPRYTVLSGTWELRHIGFSPLGGQPDYLPGNGCQWTFAETVFAFRNRGNSVSGTYYIKTGTADKPQLVLNGDESNPMTLFEVKGDTLILYQGSIGADGDIETYVKIASQN